VATKADEYRERALVCDRTANETTDQTIKQQWQELAIHWRYSANQAARLSGGNPN
jgi:hypothetical protein